jgi:hypothetical protein
LLWPIFSFRDFISNPGIEMKIAGFVGFRRLDIPLSLFFKIWICEYRHFMHWKYE